MRILAFIPARGGSKSIKLKNIFLLNGKPLIYYSIISSQKSKIFDSIICSTDNKKIAERANEYGIKVDKRLKFLSGDDTNVADVLFEFLERNKNLYDWIFLIQPTSPFIDPKDLKNAKKLILKKDKKINSIQTICETPHNFNPINSRHIREQMVFFNFPQKRKKMFNKQKKEHSFAFGNFLAVKVKSFIKYKNFFQPPSYGIIVDRKSSFDFDTLEDIEIGEFYAKSFLEKLKNI
tara:strand:+ start:8655 stop:9359 length:705 start_codon:yes stop_codon:yes gene_type:complete